VILYGLSTVAVGVMAWKLWEYAFRTYGYGDTTAVLQIPYTPLVFAMAVLSALTTLVLLALTVLPAGRAFYYKRKRIKGE
jgi:TRAP-type C4-dicarboxylate transport system permease small subunit